MNRYDGKPVNAVLAGRLIENGFINARSVRLVFSGNRLARDGEQGGVKAQPSLELGTSHREFTLEHTLKPRSEKPFLESQRVICYSSEFA
jgi:hypothetical protein